MIYYVQRKSDLRIKIGRTNDFNVRFKQLEAENRPLCVLGVHAGFNLTERAMHALFRDIRHGKTEWFSPTEELLSHIKTKCHAWTAGDYSDSEYDCEIQMAFPGEFAHWFERLTDFLDMNYLDVACLALARHAIEHGFDPPPPYPREQRNLDHPPNDSKFPKVFDNEFVAFAGDVEWAWV